jgi:hypothetical protein
MVIALIIIIVLAGALNACSDRQIPPTTSSEGAIRSQADPVPTETPSWIGALRHGNTGFSAGPPTKEELPGLGHRFELLFAMQDDQDPQNATNDVISVVTTPATIGVAARALTSGITSEALDQQLNLKYYFPSAPRTCSGGSPRLQLKIDGDADGDWEQTPGGPDQNAFGYVGRAPFGAGCITGEWDIIDMTDNVARWDLSQLGGGMTMTWDMAETFLAATYPDHQVLSGSVVDDSCSFAPAACGPAYYDLVTVENLTLENRQDTR